MAVAMAKEGAPEFKFESADYYGPAMPVLAVEVWFRVGAKKKRVKFTKRPLGIEFDNRMPIRVTKSAGHAGGLGIVQGWVLEVVCGVRIVEKTFDEALEVLTTAVAQLPQELLLRDCPAYICPRELRNMLGPVDKEEVVRYLEAFGYPAASPVSWSQVAPGIIAGRPELALGVISAHQEAGGHTWYALQCCISRHGLKARRWQVERRLAHLREMLHDPVKRDLRGTYDRHFKGAHFASHGGVPGTTARLEAWLGALAKLINAGAAQPALVALSLRFLEAPELRGGGPPLAGPYCSASQAYKEGDEDDVDEGVGEDENGDDIEEGPEVDAHLILRESCSPADAHDDDVDILDDPLGVFEHAFNDGSAIVSV